MAKSEERRDGHPSCLSRSSVSIRKGRWGKRVAFFDYFPAERNKCMEPTAGKPTTTQEQTPQNGNKSFHLDTSKSKTNSTMVGILVIIFLVTGLVVYKATSHGGSSAVNVPAPTPSFNDLVQPRFASLKEATPEISSIDCESNDCRYVVYLNFNTAPDDLQTIVRGNTATLSKFEQDNLGTSHISVAAKYNGKVIYACNGSNGKVDDCKKY